MPTLESFVRIRYRTDGAARKAMTLLNEHLQHTGLKEGEAGERLLSFIQPHENASPHSETGSGSTRLVRPKVDESFVILD